MNDLTLESLAKRVEALEKVVAKESPDQPPKDWRKVVGMFRDSEFMHEVDGERDRTPREPRGRSVAEILEAFATDRTPPDDETVRRWVDEHRCGRYDAGKLCST